MKIRLQSWNMNNKWVLLRIDGNVPMKNGIILDDNRLQQIIPTIDYILSNNGRIIILTHIGRPIDHEQSLSSKHLMPWFLQRYQTTFAETIDAISLLKTKNEKLILLENLRFFPEEKDLSVDFAKKLASYGDFYVNDAFATLHRNHTSITLLADQFSINKKSMGFLVEKELTMLNAFINREKSPSLIILGGAKLETKIPLIKHLLDHADTIFVGPALSCTFMKAQNISVGKSLVKNNLIKECLQILEKAKTSSCKLLFPQDYLVAKDSFDGPLSYTQNNAVPSDAMAISIGKKTVFALKKIINNANIIFLNGSMGFSEKPHTMESMNQLLKALNTTHATTIIAGGDTVYYAKTQKMLTHISYISTGGGATISYLSGEQLPGLQALKNRTKTQ